MRISLWLYVMTNNINYHLIVGDICEQVHKVDIYI